MRPKRPLPVSVRMTDSILRSHHEAIAAMIVSLVVIEAGVVTIADLEFQPLSLLIIGAVIVPFL